MFNLHDNEVISYEVNLQRKMVILHTYCHNRKKYFDLIFPETLIHNFKNEFYGSVILDVCEYDLDKLLLDELKEELSKENSVLHITTFADYNFWNKLKSGSFIYYAISASYGFNGIVVSQKAEMVEI